MIVAIRPVSDPKLDSGSDVPLEPVSDADAAVEGGPGFLGEEAAHTEREKRVRAADLLTAGEVISHLSADMAEGPDCLVIGIPKRRHVRACGDALPDKRLNPATAAPESCSGFPESGACGKEYMTVPLV